MLLTDESSLSKNRLISVILSHFSITNHRQAVLFFAVSFSILAVFSGAVRLFGLWFTNQIAFGVGTDLSSLAYKNSLFQPYHKQINRNSGGVISAISTKINSVIYMTLIPALTLLSSVFLVGIVMFALFVANPVAAFSVLTVVLIIYTGLAVISNRKLSEDGCLIADGSTQVVKTMQEGLRGVRDVILSGCHNYYLEEYRQADGRLRSAQARSAFISSSPRLIVESISFVVIAFTAYFFTRQNDFVKTAIPFIGTLILGAQRLLPIVQQAHASRSAIISGHASLIDVIKLLDQTENKFCCIKSYLLKENGFSIVLSDVWFRYDDNGPWVMKSLSLEIEKGGRIGLIGVTGSGKTTFVDVVMGLLRPDKGCVIVNNQVLDDNNFNQWHKVIGHVPQTVFLTDRSMAENIAFGVSKDLIDFEKLYNASKQAQIYDVINAMPNKFETCAGELGVKLSGGQRQRIAIARALYRDVSVLILDEATSALDQGTEKDVMESIDSMGKDMTMIIIAHRIDTLKNCNKIVEIEQGSVSWIGSFDEFKKRTEHRNGN
jgi:ABC-type multidrug transport system fused ATPase/permease subunit